MWLKLKEYGSGCLRNTETNSITTVEERQESSISHTRTIQNREMCAYSSVLVPSGGFLLEKNISLLSHLLFLACFAKQSWSTWTGPLPGVSEDPQDQSRAHLSKIPWNAYGLCFGTLATTALLHKSFPADRLACYCKRALCQLRSTAPFISPVALCTFYT